MAFQAVGVLSHCLANVLSMILCLVITMVKKKGRERKRERETENWLPSCPCSCPGWVYYLSPVQGGHTDSRACIPSSWQFIKQCRHSSYIKYMWESPIHLPTCTWIDWLKSWASRLWFCEAEAPTLSGCSHCCSLAFYCPNSQCWSALPSHALQKLGFHH